MNEFVVYALYSKAHDRIYIGYTSDLINRMISHNYPGKKGFTLKFRPWVVVHVEFYGISKQRFKEKNHLKAQEAGMP